MSKYFRAYIVIGLLLFPFTILAQFNNNTSSPYSRYGLGELHSYSFGRSTAMGGASIASRYETQINLANPASYTAIDSLGFMFEFGIDGKTSKFKNDIGSAYHSDINFQYFAMSFQFSNSFGASLGLVPFTDVGYNVRVEENVENTGDVITTYYGAGTISNAYFGLAFEPWKFVSLGANLNYYFGMLNRNAEVVFMGGNDFYNIQQLKSLRVNDFSLDFGTQVTIPLSKNNQLILGAIFERNPKYKAKYSDITQKNISSGSSTDQDTLYYAEEQDGTIEFPYMYGGGVSFVTKNKLEINADFYHQDWGEAKFLGEKSKFLTDLNKFAIGAEWIPDRFSIRNYYKRIAYRVGFNHEQSYLVFNNQQINQFGISFGVGLPVYRSKSTVNIAAEFGRKGTTENNLVLENYARINLMVNLYDLWFIQRRFD